MTTNSDGTAALEDQWQPSIAVAPTGSEVFVGYYDRRNDSTNTNIDTFGSFANVDLAHNGQLTWDLNNVRLTQSSFAPASADSQLVIIGYMGDNDQATADFGNFYYTFTETHTQNFNGKTVQNPSIHLAKIPVPYASTAPQIPGGFSVIKAANTSSPATLYWNGAYAAGDVVHVQYGSGAQWLDYPLTASAAAHALQLLPAYLNTATTTWYRIRVDSGGGVTSSDFAYSLAGSTPEYPAITANSFNSGTSQETINWNGVVYSAADVMHVQYSPDGGVTWNDNSFTATGGAGVIPGISAATSLFVQIQVQHASGNWSLASDGLILAGGAPNLINVARGGTNLLTSVNGSIVYSAAQSLIHGLSIVGNALNDTLSVDQSGGPIVLTDGITFDGKGGANTLAISGTSAADSLTVTSSIATFNTSPISFQNTAGVQYTDGNGNDNLSVTGTVSLTLNMGQGNDMLNVAANSNAVVNLGASNGNLTINGSFCPFI